MPSTACSCVATLTPDRTLDLDVTDPACRIHGAPTPHTFTADWRADFTRMADHHGLTHDATYIGPLTWEQYDRLTITRALDEQLLAETLTLLYGQEHTP